MRLLLFAVLLPALSAAADNLGLDAVDDAGELSITLTVSGDGLPAHWAALETVCADEGLCSAPRTLAASLSLPAPGQTLVHKMRAPLTSLHRTYHVSVRPVNAAGLPLTDLESVPAAHAFVSVGDAMVIKGRLEHLGGTLFQIVRCENECWSPCDAVDAAELGRSTLELLLWANQGTTLSFYGLRADPAFGAPCFSEITAVKTAPSCDATPAEEMTWGALKEAYR